MTNATSKEADDLPRTREAYFVTCRLEVATVTVRFVYQAPVLRGSCVYCFLLCFVARVLLFVPRKSNEHDLVFYRK